MDKPVYYVFPQLTQNAPKYVTHYSLMAKRRNITYAAARRLPAKQVLDQVKIAEFYDLIADSQILKELTPVTKTFLSPQ